MGHYSNQQSSTTTTTSLPHYLLSRNPNNKTGTWSVALTTSHDHKVEGYKFAPGRSRQVGAGEASDAHVASINDGGRGERQERCGEASTDEGVEAWVLEWGGEGLCGGV